MKAAVYRKNKGLVVEETPMPEAGEDGVLVKVSATGFCGSDHSLIESGLLPDGIILGHEASGTVCDRGRQKDALREGTRVIVRPTYCGQCRECRMGKPHLCGIRRRSIGVGDLPGGFAEYVKVFPPMLIPIPPGVGSRNAALAEAFASALHGIHCAETEGGFDGQRYDLLAWVVMPNHVHVVLEPHLELPRIMCWLKGRTSRKANQILGRKGFPFWQDESFDHWIRTAHELDNVIAYVERNPVLAGLVKHQEQWPWSSANRRADDKLRSTAPRGLLQMQ